LPRLPPDLAWLAPLFTEPLNVPPELPAARSLGSYGIDWVNGQDSRGCAPDGNHNGGQEKDRCKHACRHTRRLGPNEKMLKDGPRSHCPANTYDDSYPNGSEALSHYHRSNIPSRSPKCH